MSVDTNVIVTFSEAMDATTVTPSTIELRNSSNALVAAAVSYDPGSFTATLDPNAPLAGGDYTVRVLGGPTDPRVKDVAGNALAANATSTFTTTVQVLSTTPASGATDIPTGVAPRATFSKPLDATSVTTSTVILRDDVTTNQVSIAVSYSATPPTIALVPQMPLQPSQSYTVTIKGGSGGVKDSAGMPLPVDFPFSFTTAAAPAPIQTFSVFAPTDTPQTPVANDPDAVEVGMKFRSESAGLITGVRFFKGADIANVGPHVGHLWTSAGTLLGSVTFVNETMSGWQKACFQTPIQIEANTTYVVSYFAPQGRYAATPGQFASEVFNPPLRALQDGVDGGNGVFFYGPAGGFPTGTFNSTNYWVDVVFTDPTLSAPQVLSTTPVAGATLVATSVAPTVTFSEPINPASLAPSVMLLDTAGNPVLFTISVSADNFTVTLTPNAPLLPGQAYTVILKGGMTDPRILDANGMALAADYTWSFTTEPPPSPLIGSGNKPARFGSLLRVGVAAMFRYATGTYAPVDKSEQPGA